MYEPPNSPKTSETYYTLMILARSTQSFITDLMMRTEQK